MSKTDKTNPTFVKALRGEYATTRHNHLDGVCNVEVMLPTPRRGGSYTWDECDLYVNYYSGLGRKGWPRARGIRYRVKKVHRAARAQAKRDLKRGIEPEPLRPRSAEIWYWD